MKRNIILAVIAILLLAYFYTIWLLLLLIVIPVGYFRSTIEQKKHFCFVLFSLICNFVLSSEILLCNRNYMFTLYQKDYYKQCICLGDVICQERNHFIVIYRFCCLGF